MLWNPHEKEYRNRDFKCMNLKCLSEKLGSRFTVDKIQQERLTLVTYFDRERVRMEGSKKSGAGTDASMQFSMDKSIPDAAVSTLNTLLQFPSGR